MTPTIVERSEQVIRDVRDAFDGVECAKGIWTQLRPIVYEHGDAEARELANDLDDLFGVCRSLTAVGQVYCKDCSAGPFTREEWEKHAKEASR